MKVTCDDEADALHIRLRKPEQYGDDEIKEGFILDYDVDGNTIGIEILDASSDFRPCPTCTLYSLPRNAYPLSHITHYLLLSSDRMASRLPTIDSRLSTVLITGEYQEYYEKIYGAG